MRCRLLCFGRKQLKVQARVGCFSVALVRSLTKCDLWPKVAELFTSQLNSIYHLGKTPLDLDVMTMASFRHMMPRAGLSFHSRQLQHRLLLPSVRHASTSNPTPPKPRLLEKPERFNPPSHPSRLRSKPRAYTVPLSEAERQAQKTRRYPHMMPPEGSFMYWFLTNKLVHVWITFVCSICHINKNQ